MGHSHTGVLTGAHAATLTATRSQRRPSAHSRPRGPAGLGASAPRAVSLHSPGLRVPRGAAQPQAPLEACGRHLPLGACDSGWFWAHGACSRLLWASGSESGLRYTAMHSQRPDTRCPEEPLVAPPWAFVGPAGPSQLPMTPRPWASGHPGQVFPESQPARVRATYASCPWVTAGHAARRAARRHARPSASPSAFVGQPVSFERNRERQMRGLGLGTATLSREALEPWS